MCTFPKSNTAYVYACKSPYSSRFCASICFVFFCLFLFCFFLLRRMNWQIEWLSRKGNVFDIILMKWHLPACKMRKTNYTNIIIIIITPWEFFHISFSWKLSDNKYPQVFRTLLSILADINNVVVWMVFTLPFILISSTHCTNILVTVPRAAITIGINVTLIRFLLYCFFFSSYILILLRYSFLIFSSISSCLRVSAFNVHKYL